MASNLVKIMALLYKMQDSERAALEVKLLNQMKLYWKQAISSEARKFGVNRPAVDPRFEDLDEVKSLAYQDSVSIANTYNRDVENQLSKLYEANRSGNRSYYESNMEAYLDKRNEFKSKQISIMTEQNIRQYARNRFWQMNGLRGGKYILEGPPPVCDICVGIFAHGIVTQSFVDKNPAPLHIGCPHEYVPLIKEKLDPAETWMG